MHARTYTHAYARTYVCMYVCVPVKVAIQYRRGMYSTYAHMWYTEKVLRGGMPTHSVYEEVIDTDVEQERSTHISIGEVAICSLLI